MLHYIPKPGNVHGAHEAWADKLGYQVLIPDMPSPSGPTTFTPDDYIVIYQEGDEWQAVFMLHDYFERNFAPCPSTKMSSSGPLPTGITNDGETMTMPSTTPENSEPTASVSTPTRAAATPGT